MTAGHIRPVGSADCRRHDESTGQFVDAFADPSWHERTPGLWRRLLRLAALDLVAFVALVALGEWAVRIAIPRADRFLFSPHVTCGHRIVRNSLGLREREFAGKPAPDELRVLCLGDSVTFGTGLAAEEAWPRQLESALAQRPHSRNSSSIVVINAADQGLPLSASLRLLQERGLEWEPSLIVFAFSPWMVSSAAYEVASGPAAAPAPATVAAVAAAPESAVTRALSGARELAGGLKAQGRVLFEYIHENSCLYTLAAARYRSLLYSLGIRRRVFHQPVEALLPYAFAEPEVDRRFVEAAWERLRDQLRELEAVSRRRGIRLVVLSVPSRFELSDDPGDNEFDLPKRAIRIRPSQQLASYCRELGIPHVDLLPPLRSARQRMLAGEASWDDLYIESDYAHLSAAGHSIAARAVGELLLTDARLASWRREFSSRRHALAAEPGVGATRR